MANLTMNTRATDAHTTGSPTEEFFLVFLVFVSKFNAKTRKGVVNLCLQVLHAVVHPTDNYIRFLSKT